MTALGLEGAIQDSSVVMALFPLLWRFIRRPFSGRFGDLDELVAIWLAEGWLTPTMEGRLTARGSMFRVRKPRSCIAA
jgi:hypothetical protein